MDGMGLIRRPNRSDLDRLGAVRRPQIIGTRGIVPRGLNGNGVNGRSDTRIESRVQFKTGPYDASAIELVFGNYYAPGNGVVEAAVANSIVWKAALEQMLSGTTVATHPMLIGGQQTDVLPAGAPWRRTDALPILLPASTQHCARLGVTLPGTSNWAGIATVGISTLDSGCASTSATDQVNGTGAIVHQSGGADGAYVQPLAILGIPVLPHPSVNYLGDSIPEGTGDTTGGDGNGNIGFVARGLWSVPWNGMTGVTIPWVRQCAGGDTIAANSDAYIRKRHAWPFATHFVCELIGNDLTANVPIATMQAGLIAIWKAARATIGPYGKRLQVYQTLPMPKTDAGNTAPISGYGGVGGRRDQMIAWMRSMVGTYLDGVIDPNAYVEDPARPGCWLAGVAPPDGTHPAGPGAIAAAQAVTAWASTLTIN